MDYFVVVLKDVGAGLVQLPTNFVKKWGGTLTDTLTMKSSSNIEWIVEIIRNNRKLYLGTWWDAFANDYGVVHEEAILFKYNGRTHFDVTFFNKSAVEKPHRMHPVGELPVNFFKVFMLEEFYNRIRLPNKFKASYGQAMTNPIRIYVPDGTSWRVAWEVDGSHIWFVSGWDSVVRQCGILLRDFLLFEFKDNANMYLKIARGEGQQIITTRKSINYSAAHVHESEITLWTSKITDSTISGTQPLYIPTTAVEQWFSGKPMTVDVMLPSGEVSKWSLIWYEPTGNQKPRPKQCHFGLGWYEYVKGTTLPIGQRLRFFKRLNESFISVEVSNVEY